MSASCSDNPAYSWAKSPEGQDPCQIIGHDLGGQCNGEYPLENNPPKYYGATICACSPVIYSLTSACADCKNRTYSSWSVWSDGCGTVTNSSFPSIAGVTIPSWAYLDVAANNSYSPVAAKAKAEELLQSPSSVEEPTVIITSTTSPPQTSSSGPAADSALSHVNAGAIAGGIIGGFVVLATLALAITLVIKQRRKKRVAPSAAYMAAIGDTKQESFTLRSESRQQDYARSSHHHQRLQSDAISFSQYQDMSTLSDQNSMHTSLPLMEPLRIQHPYNPYNSQSDI